MDSEEIKELVNRRRRQLLIHSFIYYRLDSNIIDDSTYDKWGMELVELQREYPEEAKQVAYAEDFKDYDGSTGMDLPIGNPEVQSRALHILDYLGYSY